HGMTALKKQAVSIFVDRSSRQWIVLDREGRYWVVPANEEGWNQRQPFIPTYESELEPVPGHYRYMLGVPSSPPGEGRGIRQNSESFFRVSELWRVPLRWNGRELVPSNL